MANKQQLDYKPVVQKISVGEMDYAWMNIGALTGAIIRTDQTIEILGMNGVIAVLKFESPDGFTKMRDHFLQIYENSARSLELAAKQMIKQSEQL